MSDERITITVDSINRMIIAHGNGAPLILTTEMLRNLYEESVIMGHRDMVESRERARERAREEIIE